MQLDRKPKDDLFVQFSRSKFFVNATNFDLPTVKLEWSGQEAFNLAEDKNYTTTANPNVAGKTISVGEGAGLLTYLQSESFLLVGRSSLL